MFDCSTTKLPAIAVASSSDWMPASGKSGKPVSGTTGSAIILPAVVRDSRSRDTYKNPPSGDQAHGQTLALPQIGRGDPPPVGTAIHAAVFPASNSGVMAINQRRSGEILTNVLIGYGTTLERPDPSLFIRPT